MVAPTTLGSCRWIVVKETAAGAAIVVLVLFALMV